MHLTLIVRYKARQLFGPVLKSKKALLGFILFFMFMLPSGIGFAQFLKTVLQQPDALEILAAAVSGILSLFVLMSRSGGLMVHQSEIEFLLPSGIRPREYMLGDLLFQVLAWFTMGGFFVTPGTNGLVITTGTEPSRILALFLLYGYLVLFGSMLAQVLGVFQLIGSQRRSLLPVLLLGLLNFPALRFVTRFPVSYSSLPLPSTAFAAIGLALLDGSPLDPSWPLLIGLYSAIIIVCYAAISRVYFFPHVRQTMSVSIGAPPATAVAIRHERAVRSLGRLTKRLHLSPGGSLWSYMVRYHLIRMVRDGSLFFASFFLILFLIIGSQFPWSTEGMASPFMGMTTYLSIIVAIILGLNWLATERENTWVLLTSPRGTAAYFQGLAVSFWVVEGVLPALAFVFFAITRAASDPTTFVAAEAGVMAGASTLILLLELWRTPPAVSL